MYIATIGFEKLDVNGRVKDDYWEDLTGFYTTVEEAKEKSRKRIAYYKKEYGDEIGESWVSVDSLVDFNYYLVHLVTGNINDVKPEMKVFGIFNNVAAMLYEIGYAIKTSEHTSYSPLTKENFLITSQPLNATVYDYKNFD